MGYMDKGDAQILLHPAKLGPHLDAQVFVQRRQWLVKKQNPGLGDGGAGKGDTLLLAT